MSENLLCIASAPPPPPPNNLNGGPTYSLPPPSQSSTHIFVSQGSWVRYPVWQHTFVSPSAFLRGAFVRYWQKYVHEVLVNCLGGLRLPRKSVVRFTDHPHMTLDVYRGPNNNVQIHCK